MQLRMNLKVSNGRCILKVIWIDSFQSDMTHRIIGNCTL